MALSNCYGCKKEISDQLTQCIHCGFEIPHGSPEDMLHCVDCKKLVHYYANRCCFCGCKRPSGMNFFQQEPHAKYIIGAVLVVNIVYFYYKYFK